ncbi:MAG: hypothetical protein MUF86_02280 [Akkermansiaceae bacterium]|jgi:hypothetical protein|nr:hypothetical protein [Akkermansiaceae bacterium]
MPRARSITPPSSAVALAEEEAPKGRNIPAQGIALGSRHPTNPSPEGAAQGGKWPIVPLSDLAVSMKNGIYKHASAYAEDGIPCLRMYNIEDGRIVWKDIKRMRLTNSELDDYGLLPGDLLVNRVNSRELVGKTAPIPDALGPCVFESKNIRVRLDRHRVDPK